MYSKISRSLFHSIFALLITLCITVSAFADDETISYNIYVVGEDRSGNVDKLIAAGHTVTWQPDEVQFNQADLSSYDQVWFIIHQNVPNTTGRTNLINYVRSGGNVFFLNDYYRAERAPLYKWRDDLLNELGAGGVEQSATMNPAQSICYTNPFHPISYSPNAVHYIEHESGRSGSFSRIGNGEIIVGAGLDATGSIIGIAFDYGRLTNAISSRAAIYLNSNNIANWDLFVENLAKYLGPKDRIILSVKNTKALPGNVGNIKISLHNNKEISGMQFKLQDIPDLISPVQLSTTYRTNNFAVSYELDASGKLSVVLSSESGSFILQGTGDILTLKYSTRPDIQVGDSALIALSDVIVSDKFGAPVPTSIFNGKFYCDILKGDIILDGDINILDLVRAINIILERPPDPENYELLAADYNSDSAINILDIVAIINVILGREPARNLSKVSAPAQFVSLAPISAGDDVLQIPINIQCDRPIYSAQLKILYDSENIEIGDPVLSPRAEKMTLANYDRSGSLKILLYSLGTESISATADPIFYLPVTIKSKVADGPMISVKDVLLVDRNGCPICLTGIEELSLDPDGVPGDFSLFQNYPNPFNAETEISYQLPKTAAVNLTIYNLLGEQINTLVDKQQTAGKYKIHWNGKDKNGNTMATGIYLVRFQADQYAKSRKLTILK